MSEDYKIQFENFDKSKIPGTYTRIHYGTVKVGGLKFEFGVFETYLHEYNYLNFSINFINALPGRAEEVGNYVVNATKDKLLKSKTK